MKTKAIFIFLLLALTIAGCKSKKGIDEKALAEKNAPEWVKAKPILPGYYVGIGIADKTTDAINFASTAKNNALNDLASEIEVKINANSVLYSLEKSGQFKEDYLSTTRLKSDLKLEQFEAVDSWQNNQYYYVYYRLSKADYEAMVARKRNEAATKAAAFIGEARNQKNSQNYVGALNKYMQALLEIKEYAGDALEVSVEGESGFVSSILATEVNSVITGMEVTLAEGVLKFDFVERDSPTGFYLTSTNGKMLKNMPLSLQQPGTFSQKLITNSNNLGFVQFSPTDLKISKPTGNIEVELMVNEMLSENHKNNVLIKAYLNNFKPYKQTIGYQVDYPSLFIEGMENNLNVGTGNQYFKNALQQSASNLGFPVVNSKQKAQVWVQVLANTQEGSVTFDLYTALLSGKIEFYNANTENLLFTYPLTNHKGVGLNYQTAGINAYEKATDKIKQEALQGFIKSFN